jgi:single-strand DNA-binding protein
MSINRVELLGNLGSNPESKKLDGGGTLTKFPVATNKYWTDEDGNKQQSTQWSRVVCFGRQAENCMEYLEKGSRVFVEGELNTRSWDNDDGETQYITEVKAQKVHFLGGTSDTPDDVEPPADVADDEIPF